MLFKTSSIWLFQASAFLYGCNAQQNGQPEVAPPENRISVTSTLVLEPKQSLAPGIIYADPEDNPFHGNLLSGPIETAIIAVFNDTEEAPEKVCVPPGQGKNQTWHNLLTERLFPNGSVQQVGFSHELLPFLNDQFNESIISEITPGSFFHRVPTNVSACNGDLPTTVYHDKRKVFPADERIEVFDTRVYPFSIIGVIGADRCTGTLIGPRHVLTAGHCVHKGEGGTWSTDLDFTLIKRAGEKGVVTTTTFKWAEVWSVKGWTKHSNIEYDYALINLETQDTGEGWMSFGYNTAIDDGWGMNVVGYPEDKPFRTMWRMFGKLVDASNQLFKYYIDTNHGQSGAPVYLFTPPSFRRIYGVHGGAVSETSPNFPDFWNTHTNTWNRAARINKARFKQICGWMKSNLC